MTGAAKPARQGRWQTLGLELIWREWGPEDAPALVLLHGFLDHGLAFAPIAAALGERWRVIVPDHRGHGDSGHIGAGGYYHFPDYVLDLDGLYRAAGLESAIVAGHSMGSSIAVYFAGSFPERVAALVLLDGLGMPHVPASRSPDKTRRWVNDVRRRTATEPHGAPDLDTMALKVKRLSPGLDPARARELAQTAAALAEDGRWYWRFDPLHRTAAPMPFDVERYEAFLDAITCPTLVIWGGRSPMRLPDIGSRMAHLADVRDHVLPGVGHNVHHEAPDEVARVMAEFLDGLGGGGS